MQSNTLTPSSLSDTVSHLPILEPSPWALDDALTMAQLYQRYLDLYNITGETSIPWIVRFMENPASPVKLSGAVSLFQHDLIHCLLGRGIRNIDEAFVIGFTMGSVKTLKWYEVAGFKFVSRYLYPDKFRLTKQEIQVFQDGVQLACSMPELVSLAAFEPAQLLHLPVQQVRSQLGILTQDLEYTLYAENRPE